MLSFFNIAAVRRANLYWGTLLKSSGELVVQCFGNQQGFDQDIENTFTAQTVSAVVGHHFGFSSFEDLLRLKKHFLFYAAAAYGSGHRSVS